MGPPGIAHLNGCTQRLVMLFSKCDSSPDAMLKSGCVPSVTRLRSAGVSSAGACHT